MSRPSPEVEQRQGSLQLDSEIARLCQLPTAQFPFDSAEITGEAATVLDGLAACLSGEGALAGRSLKIVGHADPRGTLEYNFALGQLRAGSVEQYLASRGLDPERTATTSMGELEAVGTDEEGWARDRKVEILLAENAYVPERTGQLRTRSRPASPRGAGNVLGSPPAGSERSPSGDRPVWSESELDPYEP